MHGLRGLFLVFAVFAAGCASRVESTMLMSNTALVSAISDKPEDEGKVIDVSLLEAARLTASKGFQYFVAMDGADRVGRRIQELSQRGPNERNLALPLSYWGGSVLAPVFRSDPGVKVPYTRPRIDLTIRMYREGEVDPKAQGVWSVAEILRGNLASLARP